MKLLCKKCHYKCRQKVNLKYKKNQFMEHCLLVRHVITNLARKGILINVWEFFFCKACDNEFRYNVSLKTHEKSVHEDYNFVLCDM